MSELPTQQTDDPREMDHGELFRPDPRQLPIQVKKTPRDIKFALGIAAAAIAAALFTLTR